MKYYLINGDNNIYLKEFKDNTIDLVITSPPYDDLRKYDGFSCDFEIVIRELYRIVKEGGVVIWNVDDQYSGGDRTLTSFKQALKFKEVGFKVSDIIIFEKNNTRSYSNAKRYRHCWEFVFIFVKGEIKTFNSIDDCLSKNYLINPKSVVRKNLFRNKEGELKELKERKIIKRKKYLRRTNIWRYNVGYNLSTRDKIAFSCPAVMQEQLIIDCIKTWSNEGYIVLDPFCGSGSVLKCACMLGRIPIGIEISKKYCDVTEKRMNNYCFVKEENELFFLKKN